jgi:DNA-binding MarR family transcriptional regulator
MPFHEVIHQPTRLRIMSSLCALATGDRTEFTIVRKALGVTDGNLGGHLRTLAAAGYVEIEKSFVDQKPRTRVRATAAGRDAFVEHVLALQEIIREPDDLGSRGAG